jgi:hypothetical protein
MPYLSNLTPKYQNKVTVLGVDIYENKTMAIRKIKAFVDSMGDRLAYPVAAYYIISGAVSWYSDKLQLPGENLPVRRRSLPGENRSSSIPGDRRSRQNL